MQPTRQPFLQLMLLLITVLVISATSMAQTEAHAEFAPLVRMLGLYTTEGTIEWVVTVNNLGTATGENVVLTDVLVDALRVEHVQIATGTTRIEGQTVVVSIPNLAPNESVQFSIFTTPLADAVISNTICLRATNFTGEECAFAFPIQMLPSTGETPQWRTRLQWMSLVTVSLSLLMIGVGLLGWRLLHD